MWKTIFEGVVEGRPVVLKEYDDGDGSRELRVETNYGSDQMIGDIPGVIGYPVSADDSMHVDASTPEELVQKLIELGAFSVEAAKDIARHGWSPKNS